jgi:nitroreductase
MSTFIQDQEWRYATKKFDSDKKISEQDITTLKKAMQLSSSSYGLQPYKIFFVENTALRAQIQPVAWGQSQIVDASHLIVIANDTKYNDVNIEAYINNICKTRGLQPEDVKMYADYMKSKIQPLSEEEFATWTSKQTYLVLGNLLNAAAELKIDVTPMEGFVPEEVNKILGLNEINLNASLLATVGYRHADDKNQHLKKVRKSDSELFITIQ